MSILLDDLPDDVVINTIMAVPNCVDVCKMCSAATKYARVCAENDEALRKKFNLIPGAPLKADAKLHPPLSRSSCAHEGRHRPTVQRDEYVSCRCSSRRSTYRAGGRRHHQHVVMGCPREAMRNVVGCSRLRCDLDSNELRIRHCGNGADREPRNAPHDGVLRPSWRSSRVWRGGCSQEHVDACQLISISNGLQHVAHASVGSVNTDTHAVVAFSIS